MASISILPKRDVPRGELALDRRTSAVALAAVSCAIAILGLVGHTSGAVTLPGGAAVAPVLVSIAVAMGLVALRAVLCIRLSASRVEKGLGWVNNLHLCPTTLDAESGPVDDGSRQGPESLALRTLRAQVRTLEQALEQEQRHFAPASPSSDQPALAAFRRDVLLTVKALGARTASDEGGRHTLARLTAAIERLDAGDTFARPVLAPAATVLAMPARPRPRIIAAAPLPEEGTSGAAGDAAPTVTVEESVPEHQAHLEQPDAVAETPSDMASSLPPLPIAPSDVVEAAPQVVLPVPSLMTDTQTQRGRRWFRRSAA